MYTKPEFVSATEKHVAYFIVAQNDLQAFKNHLAANQVTVNTESCMTVSQTDFMMLEVQQGIPPKDGNAIASSFKP
jgi:hypothetical protein